MASSRNGGGDRQKEDELRRVEWMLSKKLALETGPPGAEAPRVPSYGDLTTLNTAGLILDSVGQALLSAIVDDFMVLLDTSCAVYEKNGDYALGIFTSSWCQFMDSASRDRCGTPDNREALASGKWHCHESCWNQAARRAIEGAEPVDMACRGGIRLFAVPIRAGEETIGSISVGYGDPPKDPARLRELAATYDVSVEELRHKAEAYESRPPFLIALAKKNILSAARFVGEIVERKQAEKALRKSEEKLRSLVEATSDWVWEVDQGGVYTYSSPKVRDLLGYEPEEVLGKTPFDFMPSAERDGVAQIFLEARQSASPFVALENTNLHKNGQIVELETSGVPIMDADGKLVGYRGIDRDITRRKLAEKQVTRLNALKEQLIGRGALNEKLSLITEAVVDIYNADFARIWITKEGDLCEKGCLHAGVTEGPHLCRDRSRCLHLVASSGRYTHLDGGHRRVPLAAYKIGHIASGREAFFLTNDVTHDPSVHNHEWAAALGLVSFAGFRLISPEDRPTGVLALFNKHPMSPEEMRLLQNLANIASQVVQAGAAEEERLKMEARMREVQKLESLGVLAGGIAHDFNNLLMAILGNAELALLSLSPVSPARQSLEEIMLASQRASDLCRQMLAYSGKGRLMIGRYDLSEIVREMEQMLEVSVSKKALIRYSLAEGLPAVEADAMQIRQVIMNLITNASESLGEASGVISITTRVMECDQSYLSENYLGDGLQEGRYVCIEVSDTGCGMDAEIRSRIFDPFYTTKFIGRGLGLAAVLGIIRGHKGGIKVDSEPGKGTTFKILLPAVDWMPSDRGRKAEQSTPLHGGDIVLLIDDDAKVRNVASKMLTSLGFQVLTTANAREGLEVFHTQRNKVACVILDLTMPDMGGEETFRELRKLRSDARVILSSGFNEQDVTQSFIGMGLAGFIQKPYTITKLRDALNQALS